jgi:hypothetical protein
VDEIPDRIYTDNTKEPEDKKDYCNGRKHELTLDLLKLVIL